MGESDKEACRMELTFLIFLAFSHQLASALLGQPPEKISPKNDERSKGICDGRVLQHSLSQHSRPQPKNNFPTPELIRSNGYPAEEHWATTPDGYILALHRIPHGLNNKDKVVVGHGAITGDHLDPHGMVVDDLAS